MSEIKFKIMKHKPDVSEEEILSFMDFDAVLSKQASVLKATSTSALVQKGLLVVGGVAIISAVWFYSRTEDPLTGADTAQPEQQLPAEEPVLPSADSNPAAVIDDEQDNQPPVSTRKKQVTATPKTQGEDTEERADPGTYVYEQATPVHGYGALYEYFQSELVYPAEAIRDSIQGIVTVTFLINTEGRPDQVTIESSPGQKMNEEAIRLIKNMPAWNPATLNGKPVTTRLSIPITFQIIPVKNKEQ